MVLKALHTAGSKFVPRAKSAVTIDAGCILAGMASVLTLGMNPEAIRCSLKSILFYPVATNGNAHSAAHRTGKQGQIPIAGLHFFHIGFL